jgi:hypothetical protein
MYFSVLYNPKYAKAACHLCHQNARTCLLLVLLTTYSYYFVLQD